MVFKASGGHTGQPQNVSAPALLRLAHLAASSHGSLVSPEKTASAGHYCPGDTWRRTKGPQLLRAAHFTSCSNKRESSDFLYSPEDPFQHTVHFAPPPSDATIPATSSEGLLVAKNPAADVDKAPEPGAFRPARLDQGTQPYSSGLSSSHWSDSGTRSQPSGVFSWHSGDTGTRMGLRGLATGASGVADSAPGLLAVLGGVGPTVMRARGLASSGAAGGGARGAPTPDSASGGRGTGPRVAMEGVDPTLMSREEIRAVGARPHPPGQQPGGALHQSSARRLLTKQMWPLYPLFACVGLGVGLATWTMYRELVQNPAVKLSKRARSSSDKEMREPGEVEDGWQRYFRGSHLRHLSSAKDGVTGATKEFGFEPPVLPGDHKEAAGKAFQNKRVEVQQ